MNRISVIIPVYNDRENLDKCLDALVDHFRVKAPERFTGTVEPLHSEGAPSREDIAAGLRRAAGEGGGQG